jgi:hypothetical protein
MTEEEEEVAFGEIIGILQKARKKPFSEDEALNVWSSVLDVARFHKRAQPLSGAERKQAKEIVAALSKARRKIEKALKLPNLANALIGTWEMVEHYDVPVVEVRRKADFQGMVDGLVALEGVAREVAPPRRKGRPKNFAVTTLLPSPTIHQLTRLYERATGLQAKLGLGPFQRLVSAFTKGFVRPKFQDEAIVKAIQRTKVLKSQRLMPWKKA